MIGLISKECSDKKYPEVHEQQLRKSLAEKVSQYEEPSDNPSDNFTELFIEGRKLRVVVEEITITGDLTGSFAKPSKDDGCLMPAENSECDFRTPLRYSSVEKSPKIDSAMKVSNQINRDCQDDANLDIEGLKNNTPIKFETIDLVLEQGQQNKIDIVLEQESHSQDSHETEGDIDHKNEGIKGIKRCTSFILESDCDYPSSQSETTEVLFDNEFVVLNGEYLNSITRFHLDQTFQPDNVRTWGPKLVAKKCIQLAKQGNRRAQYRLGCMYVMGFGVQQNYLMAYIWIKISALQHSPKASLKLKEIESLLTTVHIDYARQLSEQYYEMYVAPFLPKKLNLTLFSPDFQNLL